MTAGGSACCPPFLVIEPEWSSTRVIMTLARVLWAVSLTVMVRRLGTMRAKNVLMVVVAVTLICC